MGDKPLAIIGQVNEITGAVYIKESTGELVQLAEGMPIYQNQILVAGPGGSISIMLINGEMFTLGQNSIAELDEDVVTQAEIDESMASEQDLEQILAKILEGNVNELEATASGNEEGNPNSSSIQDGFSVNGLGTTGNVTSGHETGNNNGNSDDTNDENGRGFETQFGILSAAPTGTTNPPPVSNPNPSEIFEIARFTDSFVNGVEYATSSGLTGLTGDTGVDGGFSYRVGDTITFKIGDVVVGEIASNEIQGEIVFLQDIAGTTLSDVNSNYVENLAIFLQALDDDLADANDSDGLLQTNQLQNTEEAFSNGINITQQVRDLFVGYIDSTTGQPLNIETAGKEMISLALAHAGIEFTRESETDASGENVFETIAMQHVADTIVSLSGDRAPETFDERLVDVLTVPGNTISYNFNDASGTITFSTDDLLLGAVGQQVTTQNLVVKNVVLPDAFAGVGELIDLGDGNYQINLRDGFSVDHIHELEGLTINYRVEDWTAFREATLSTLDTYKSHLSAVIQDVPEDVGFNQFTLNSSLAFDQDSTLKLEFTSESLSQQLGKAIAEYADDYSMPVQYSIDGGNTWIDIRLDSMTLVDGIATPTFAMTLPAGSSSIEVRVPIFDDAKIEDDEFFNAKVTGDQFYDEVLEFQIIDNDSIESQAGLPLLSIDYVYSLEGQGSAEFVVSLNQVSLDTVTVDYDATSLAAIAGTDFADVAGTLTFLPGETSKAIEVAIVDDLLVEDIEMAFINIKNPNNALIEDGQGSLRIFDNDGADSLPVSLDIDPITADSIVNFDESTGSITVSGTVSAQNLVLSFVTLEIGNETYNVKTDETGSFSVDIPGSVIAEDADKVVEGSVIAFDQDGQKGSAVGTESYSLQQEEIKVSVANDSVHWELDDTKISHIAQLRQADGSPYVLAAGATVAIQLEYTFGNGFTVDDFESSQYLETITITGDGSSSSFEFFNTVYRDTDHTETTETYELKAASVVSTSLDSNFFTVLADNSISSQVSVTDIATLGVQQTNLSGNDDVDLSSSVNPVFVIGGMGDNTISGGHNTDALYGGDGNDIINGGAGEDFIFGEAGDDFLYGGAGDDVYFGGTGNDTFKVDQNSTDRIVDFENGSDRIDIKDILTSTQADAADLMSRISLAASDIDNDGNSDDILMTVDGDGDANTSNDQVLILLDNVAVADINEDDFIYKN